MDGPSFENNTDVLVVADPTARTLVWVPRDLWCKGLSRRVNKAYALGGHERLIAALAEHDIRAEHSICLRPDGIRPALHGVRLTIPVREEMELDYEGEWVHFAPPAEELSGERIHAWIGARTRSGPAPPGWLPDLDRIRRQQELIAVMLGEGFGFRRFISAGPAVRVSGDAAIDELSQVRWDWEYSTLDDVVPREIDGQKVLVRTTGRA
jgi:anionic cell wall polymer biosynthesis LytR-Cps2A-Psr (LCP) family protein